MAVSIDRAAASVQLAGHSNYGQVEPNHLSAPRNGRVYAQLPADDSIEVLENGTFVKYDYANDKVDFAGEGSWMMVFNEEKLYDERKQMHRDFAMVKADALDGVITPRVFGMSMGDIFTTNMVAAGSYAKGDILVPGADGVLAAGAKGDGLAVQVVAETTLPDGQPAVKLQVIAE